MRAGVLIALVAACSPDILTNSFLCGPNEACPDTQLCDEQTNACVTPINATGFSCAAEVETFEPDNTEATGAVIGKLDCVSAVYSDIGCLAAGDSQDWLQFTAPTGCTAVAVQVKLNYKVAFEPLQIVLYDSTGTQIATDADCKNATLGQGEDDRCLTQTITSGQSYGLQIKALGGNDCDGECQFNRYSLTVQLVTP